MKMRNIFVLLALVIGAGVLSGCGCGEKKNGKAGVTATVQDKAVESAPAAGLAYTCEDELSDIAVLPLPPGAEKNPPPAPVIVVVGNNDTIARSADGGRTWKRMIPRREKGRRFHAIIFATASEGWAVSLDLLLHTADGGLSWQPANVFPEKFYYFGPSFARPGMLYQMQTPTCSAKIWTTVDGGLTWKDLPSVLPRNDYESIFVLDEQRIWLAGNYGRFARTIDGGRSWETISMPSDGHLLQPQFITADEGWLRVGHGHNGTVLHTVDGGRTWKPQATGMRSYWGPVDMQFIDRAAGWLLVDMGSDGSQLLRTTDGGEHWVEAIAFPDHLVAMDMPGERDAWLASRDGKVYHIRLNQP